MIIISHAFLFKFFLQNSEIIFKMNLSNWFHNKSALNHRIVFSMTQQSSRNLSRSARRHAKTARCRFLVIIRRGAVITRQTRVMTNNNVRREARHQRIHQVPKSFLVRIFEATSCREIPSRVAVAARRNTFRPGAVGRKRAVGILLDRSQIQVARELRRTGARGRRTAHRVSRVLRLTLRIEVAAAGEARPCAVLDAAEAGCALRRLVDVACLRRELLLLATRRVVGAAVDAGAEGDLEGDRGGNFFRG